MSLFPLAFHRCSDLEIGENWRSAKAAGANMVKSSAYFAVRPGGTLSYAPCNLHLKVFQHPWNGLEISHP